MSRKPVVVAPLLGAVVFLGSAGPLPDEPVSEVARESCETALRWLVHAQNRDGSWGDNPGAPGEVGNTCIAALALLAEGSTLTRGRYCVRLRKAVDWVRARTRGYGAEHAGLDTATLLQRKLGENIDLYLVALLYSQVLGLNVDNWEDDHMQGELGRMVDRIASLQKPNGEWETSYEPMLTTICAWLALRQAHDAGIAVHGASPLKVLKYLRTECLEQGTGIFREKKWGNRERFVTQAGGIRVFYGMGQGRTQEARKATEVILRMRFDQDVGGRSGGEEFLGALFATQALHLEGGEAYEQWYPKIVKALVACQNRDGSWMGHHCITGRVFCTSCSVIAMLTPDKMLPMIER